MIHIKEFLDCIPQLSSYFIPGFIFLYVRQYAQIKEVKKIDFSYRAIIASFIIKAFVDTLFQIKFFVNAPLSVVYLTYYIVAALAPILEFALRNALWANRLFRDTFQLSLTTDIWARTIGTDGKSCLRVYLNSDISIMGVPKYFDEDYLLLVKYAICDSEGEIPEPQTGSSITIPIKNIKYFESVYTDTEAKLRKLNLE